MFEATKQLIANELASAYARQFGKSEDEPRDDHGRWTSGGGGDPTGMTREDALRAGYLFHGMSEGRYQEMLNSKGFEGGGFSDTPQQSYGPRFIAVNTKDMPKPVFAQGTSNQQFGPFKEPFKDAVPVRSERDVAYYHSQLYALSLDHVYEADKNGNIIGPVRR